MEDANWDKANNAGTNPPGAIVKLDIKEYGSLNQDTLEAILVGYLIGDNDLGEKDWSSKPADYILESGIKGEWFENAALGDLFNEFLKYYRASRIRMTTEELREKKIGPKTPDEANVLWDNANRCVSTAVSRKIKVDFLVGRFKNRHFAKKAQKLFQDFQKDPDRETQEGIEKYRQTVMLGLIDQSGGVMRCHDWAEEYDKVIGDLVDMKRNPDKYVGHMCGIEAIDNVTRGFRPGQMTTLIGAHGGFKTTLLTNIAYGLWENDKNVLYASLETEPHIMEAKLCCRGTRRVSFARLFNGWITEPEDWAAKDALEKLIPTLSGDEKKKAEKRLESLSFSLQRATKGQEDTLLLQQFREHLKSKQNRLIVANTGQSQKMKISQLDGWLNEKRAVFKPDVVVLDYLALVASDTRYPDRPDLEIGEVCKALRNIGERLGFHIVTAAQYKRRAIERIRENGMETPEKAQIGTDDIAESNAIGADSDYVFALWREDGGNRLRVFNLKNRHGAKNDDKGVTLQVDADLCMISDHEIEDTSERAATKGMADARRSLMLARDGKGPSVIEPDDEDDIPSAFPGSQVDDGTTWADPLEEAK